jgi:hypothetical protein
MAQPMGLGIIRTACPKQKNRWFIKIDGITEGLGILPPSKSARPNISFKEMEVQHVVETIYFPSKPDWKPINLVLYDFKSGGLGHPVAKWVNKCYEVRQGNVSWKGSTAGFKQDISLELYDGCGNTIEKWVYENAYPNTIEFGELDMQSSEIVTCDLTIRYDRAYVTGGENGGSGSGGGGGGIAQSQGSINSRLGGFGGIA